MSSDHAARSGSRTAQLREPSAADRAGPRAQWGSRRAAHARFRRLGAMQSGTTFFGALESHYFMTDAALFTVIASLPTPFLFPVQNGELGSARTSPYPALRYFHFPTRNHPPPPGSPSVFIPPTARHATAASLPRDLSIVSCWLFFLTLYRYGLLDFCPLRPPRWGGGGARPPRAHYYLIT